MNKWMAFGMGLAVSAGLTHRLGAQDVPAAPPAAAAAAPMAGQAAGFLGGCKAMLAGCKEKLCASPLGQLLNSSLAPVTAMSGGLIPPCCPAVNPADLLKPGSQGAAAKIKQAEAEAKAKRAAIRYLSTLDCHWWPEAEAGLIAALRAERNECVRLEAALALGRGCCCTKRTLLALLICVNGTEEDNNVSENSDRVKAAAAAALAHCLSCYQEVKAAKGDGGKGPVNLPEPVRKVVAKDQAQPELPEIYVKVGDKMTWEQLVGLSRKALAQTTTSAPPPGVVAQGHTGHSLAEIVSRAMSPQESALPGADQLPSGAATQAPPESMAANTNLQPLPAGPAMMSSSAATPSTGPVIINGPGQPISSPGASASMAAANKPWWVRARTSQGQQTAQSPFSRPAQSMEMNPVVPAPVTYSTSYQEVANPARVTAAPAVKAASYREAASQAKPTTVLLSRDAEPTSGPIENHQQMLALLQRSAYPEQREWAAENLASFDWRLSPEIVTTLLSSAHRDSETNVRVACLRCLARMNVNTPQVITTVRAIQADKDPQVRAQAHETLSKLTANQGGTNIRLTP